MDSGPGDAHPEAAGRMMLWFWLLLLAPAAAAEMGYAHCASCDSGGGGGFWSLDNMVEMQKVSDLLIATAYFSIPLELFYFAGGSRNDDLLPPRWVLVQLGAFIVLYGLTHLLAVFTYNYKQPHPPFAVAALLTTAKLLTALVSSLTAITLLKLIPQLLRVKVREHLLRAKASELDRGIALMIRQEEASRHARAVTEKIRRSLDRRTVLDTTVSEISRVLVLSNCAVWMPSDDDNSAIMCISHALHRCSGDAGASVGVGADDMDVLEVTSSGGVKLLPPDSVLGSATASAGGDGGKEGIGTVAAIRVPMMLKAADIKGGNGKPEPELGVIQTTSYGVLVLVPPSGRNWAPRELEMVEVVADQVAVALSHASLLEESEAIRDTLAEQHREMLRARHDARMATEATDAFQRVLTQEMRRPVHDILGLTSALHKEEGPTMPEQKLVVDTMARAATVVSMLIDDYSMEMPAVKQKQERVLLEMEIRPFHLHSMIRDATSAARCLCGIRGFGFAVHVEDALPDLVVVGDDRRIFHVLLQMLGSLIGGGTDRPGSVTFRVRADDEAMGDQYWKDPWKPSYSDRHQSVKFAVAVKRQRSEKSSSPLAHQPSTKKFDLRIASFSIRKLVETMEGNFWHTLDGQRLPDSMTLVLRFQLQPSNKIAGLKVEEPRSTTCKDAMPWVAMEKQRQKELNHTCVQKVGHKLLGRDDIRKNIMEEILLDRKGGSKCTVICINGGSGLGKTSLLRVLYNDHELMDDFDKRIWIKISDKYDILMLFRKIIEFSMNEHCSITNISLLQELVMEEIANKKFLLFLDDADIEDQQFWTNVLEVLNAGIKGSALVMATRSSAGATLRNVATHSYFLNPLSEENNQMLLQQYAFVGTDIQSHPDLVMIAKRFITRFGSNPLNLKAIGGLLCHADSISLEMDRFEENVMPLKLCHDVLPIHMKKCLAFCSLFPEGYIFDKHHMVLQWISHGCVSPVEGCELEDAGVEYFNELLCRSFFQYSPVHNDKDDKFVMHELVYEVLESVSRDRYFKSEDILSGIPENILHLSLVSSQFQTIELMSKTELLNDLQTFMVVQPEWQPYKIPFPTLNLVGLDDFLRAFTSLEILDLSHTDTEELPGSIAGLRNLKYLSVNNTSIRTLPSELCSLSNLQTLEAKDCRFLTELPGDTKKLLKLRHLDVTKELGYVQLPRGVGQLTELHTLPVFHASSYPSHCSVSELGSLHNLRGSLRLSGLESVKTGSKAQEANLKDKHHLKDLALQWHDGGIDVDDEDQDEDDDTENVAELVLESLWPHTNLQELAIRCYEGSVFPAWMQGTSSLLNLLSLTLDGCCNCTQFPDIAELPSLKFLSVRKMYGVQRLVTNNTQGSTTKFPSLELLNLWEMYGLEELFESSDSDCPRLHKICVSRCPDLKRLPCSPSVRELVLHCGRELPDIPELASLVSLRIEGFHGVESFSLPALPVLKKMEIRSCKVLSSVDGLSALTTVQRLKVAGCPKLVLPRTDVTALSRGVYSSFN